MGAEDLAGDDDLDDGDGWWRSLVAEVPRPDLPRLWLVQVLHVAARTLASRYRSAVADLGLTYPQLTVMACLWNTDRLPVSVLCEQLCMTSATVSPLVRRLEERGLVAKECRYGDARCTVVALTDAGEAMRAAGVAAVEAVAGSDGLTARSREELVDELQALLERVAADHRRADFERLVPSGPYSRRG